jgi:hypothetical protein
VAGVRHITHIFDALAGRAGFVFLARRQVVFVAVQVVRIAALAVARFRVRIVGDLRGGKSVARFRALARTAGREGIASDHACGGVALALNTFDTDGVACGVKASASVSSSAHGASRLGVLAVSVGVGRAATASGLAGVATEVLGSAGSAEAVLGIKFSAVHTVAGGADVTVRVVVRVVVRVASGAGVAFFLQVELVSEGVAGTVDAHGGVNVIRRSEGIFGGAVLARSARKVVEDRVDVVLDEIQAGLDSAGVSRKDGLEGGVVAGRLEIRALLLHSARRAILTLELEAGGSSGVARDEREKDTGLLHIYRL